MFEKANGLITGCDCRCLWRRPRRMCRAHDLMILTLFYFTLIAATSSLPATPITAAAAIPNPFKKLPWNAKREREREARRLKQESAILHRQLGITEDASYEEITAACDRLIAKAGDDMKAKIKIEVAKDKILQLRLNARLAGLSEVSKDARAQSTFEVDG